MRLISYNAQRVPYMTATDMSLVEFSRYMMDKYGDMFGITYVVELNNVQFQRWQAEGRSTLLKRDLNAD